MKYPLSDSYEVTVSSPKVSRGILSYVIMAMNGSLLAMSIRRLVIN
jgi:hypothetical protein